MKPDDFLRLAPHIQARKIERELVLSFCTPDRKKAILCSLIHHLSGIASDAGFPEVSNDLHEIFVSLMMRD